MHPDIVNYNQQQEPDHRAVCDLLARAIDKGLPEAESKIWHRHPVWFLDGNPTVGYSKQKPGIRLMFWSGADFDEDELNVLGKKFKDASVFFNHASEIRTSDLQRWLEKAQEIQWDYRNLARRKGRLERLK
ncbi:DUF1801 domain-containing protein [Natronospirillum operosum]|uniref:DUF1801 domain-containing protein n=1 Tax=Natronospirillum operosum TaxID=2759953 RepID=A0A4Z0WDL3_9GAMM|nr:DUF1801 domain-containing protein [Natronospirillum operosum]TGG92839.1 DUF1801 domain-containing protein [Natronospirillum operosum]